MENGVGTAAVSGNPVQDQLGRLGRYRRMIIAIAIAAAFLSGGYAWTQGTTYTGTSALIVSSGGGDPDSDARVAQGYVEYFNQDFAKGSLTERTALADGVSISARTSATSSIVYIEAAAASAELAATSARRVAEVFRDDVNLGRQQDADRIVARLTEELDAARRSFGSEPPERSGLVSTQIDLLQHQIIEVQSDGAATQLKDMQLDPGISATGPGLLLNALLGLLGGLVLGVVAALVLASVEDRLVSANDVSRKLGLPTLGVVGRGRRAEYVQQLKAVATTLALNDPRRPVTLAVTAIGATRTAAWIAESIAVLRAQQGEPTMLILTDPDLDRHGVDPERRGTAEFLARPDADLGSFVLQSRVEGLRVVPGGQVPDDPFAVFAPWRCAELVQQATALADLVVIAAPPLADAGEAQAICAAADRTILVIEENSTRSRDALVACELLSRVYADVQGVVLAHRSVGQEIPVSGIEPLTPVPWQPSPYPRAGSDVEMAGGPETNGAAQDEANSRA